MWIRNILLVLILVIQPFRSHCSERKVIFRSNSTVQINQIKFSELNCSSTQHGLEKLCANITEVTCSRRASLNSPKLVSCIVTNRDSILFNSTIVDKNLICKGKRLFKGNCRLNFSPKLTLQSAKALKLNTDGTIAWDPFEEHRMNETRGQMEYRQREDNRKNNKSLTSNENVDRSQGVTVFAIVFGAFLLILCVKVTESMEIDCCCCRKPKPIISEDTRRNDSPSTSQIESQENQQSVYPAFISTNDFKKAEFTDPPPKYDPIIFDSKYAEPPSYSSLGNVNQGYVPTSIEPSAPDFRQEN